MPGLSDANHDKLIKILKWDIALYKYFQDNGLDSINKLQHKGIRFNMVIYKQHLINFIASIMGKR